MQESDIITISVNDPCYPYLFGQVNPVVTEFYAIGNHSLLTEGKRLAIVGTRAPTAYGIDTTQSLVSQAVQAQITVVSGLAIGIDSIAHRETLKRGGQTIAVLPAGITTPYPLRHTNLAKEIVARGGLLISEYTAAKPNKYCFIRRNRLIAALADLLVIPEATLESGSRHTAEFAEELGRPMAFVPGPITNPLSALPNQKIKEGAEPIINPQDIYPLLDFSPQEVLSFNQNIIGQQKKAYQNAHPIERAIMQTLIGSPHTSDQLLMATKIPLAAFNVHVTILEIKGLIRRTATNEWALAK